MACLILCVEDLPIDVVRLNLRREPQANNSSAVFEDSVCWDLNSRKGAIAACLRLDVVDITIARYCSRPKKRDGKA